MLKNIKIDLKNKISEISLFLVTVRLMPVPRLDEYRFLLATIKDGHVTYTSYLKPFEDLIKHAN